MKRITAKQYMSSGPRTIHGWVFSHAGLRLIVFKRYATSKWWDIIEYTTARGIPDTFSKRRNTAIERAKAKLDKYGSLTICQVLDVALQDTGIINKQ